MRRALIFALPALLLAAPIQAQEAGARVDVDAKDQELAAVIAAIARDSGQRVQVHYSVEARISLQARGLHWRDAVDLCALKAGCRVDKDYRGLILTQAPRGRFRAGPVAARGALLLFARRRGLQLVIGPGLTEPVRVDLEDIRSDQALVAITRAAGRYRVAEGDEGLKIIAADPEPLVGEPKPAERPLAAVLGYLPESARRRIDIDVKDIDLKAFLADLAKKVDFELRVDPRIDQRLTVKLIQIPWADALSIISQLTRCPLSPIKEGVAIDSAGELTLMEDRIAPAAALKRVAEAAGRRLRVPADLPAAPISLHLRAVPWLAVGRAVVEAVGPYRLRHDGEEIVVERRPPAKAAPRFTAPALEAWQERELTRELRAAVRSLKGLNADALDAAMKSLAPTLERRLAETGERGENLLFEAIQAERLEGPAVDLLDVSANRAVTLQGEALLARINAAIDRDPAVDLLPAKATLAALIRRLMAWKNRYGAVCAAELRRNLTAAEGRQRRLAPLAGAVFRVQGACPVTDRGPAVALINGRFYKVGEAVRDPAGAVIPELFIKAIDEGAVRFRFRGVTLTRRLE